MKRNSSRYPLTLVSAPVIAAALATAILLAMADGMFAQHYAPEANVHAGPEGIKDGKKPNEQKDAAKPANQTDPAALPQPEVLCERIQSIKIGGFTINGEQTSGDERKRASGN